MQAAPAIELEIWKKGSSDGTPAIKRLVPL